MTRKSEVEESTKKHHVTKFQPSSKENRINNEQTLILGVATTDYVASTHTARLPELSKTLTTLNSQGTKSSKNDEKVSATIKEEKTTISTVSKTSMKTFTTSTLNIETSSSIQVIESTSTKTILRPSATIVESSINTKPYVYLEPSSVSDIEYTEPISTISTPMPIDGLPASYTKTSTTMEKSVVHSTFTKTTGMYTTIIYVL